VVETTPRSRAQILQSIKDFLEEEFSPPKPRQCRRCGSAMQTVDVHFLVGGTEMDWKVSLPFCAACARAILEDLPRRESVH